MTQNLQAFLFGAGFGVRLRPLTDTRPKVAVPVMGKPVIFHAIEQLAGIGIKKMVINRHYKGDVLEGMAGDGEQWNVEIRYSTEKDILETGGGLKYAEPLISSQTFIAYNGDILCDIDLRDAIAFHRQHKAMVTLITAPWCAPRQLTLDANNRIIDIRKSIYKSSVPTHTFLGIHILEREIFSYMEHGKYSIIKTYLSLIKDGAPVFAYDMPRGYWYDIGSIEQYKLAHKMLCAQTAFSNATSCLSVMDKSACQRGYVSLGERVVIEEDVYMEDVIVWDDVTIKKGACLKDVIVRDGLTVEGTFENDIL